MPMVQLSFQVAPMFFAKRRQIVNKIVVQQFAGQTKESCNNAGLKISKPLQGSEPFTFRSITCEKVSQMAMVST